MSEGAWSCLHIIYSQIYYSFVNASSLSVERLQLVFLENLGEWWNVCKKAIQKKYDKYNIMCNLSIGLPQYSKCNNWWKCMLDMTEDLDANGKDLTTYTSNSSMTYKLWVVSSLAAYTKVQVCIMTSIQLKNYARPCTLPRMTQWILATTVWIRYRWKWRVWTVGRDSSAVNTKLIAVQTCTEASFWLLVLSLQRGRQNS